MFGKEQPVVMKVYKHQRDFEKEGAKMFEHGYDIREVIIRNGRINLVGTGAKFLLGNLVAPPLGLLWAFLKPSRQDDPITVIWEKKVPA